MQEEAQKKDINYKSPVFYSVDPAHKGRVRNTEPVFLETKTRKKKNENNFLNQVEEELERIRSGKKKIRAKVVYQTNVYVEDLVLQS